MADVTPITTLLVANRGEIARRVMRSARDMGITTVAIYADGDAEAPFVTEADSAIALNGKTSTETYLDIGKVIDACKRSGADAVHPGYGFLSENADFARAVTDAGIAWLGPSPEVIASMGDKLSAKKLMQDAGVPTLPAIEITADTDLNAAAQEIGYPVLVKASAGGGGRGMRVVEAESDLADAVDSARREAGSSFGDDTVFLEKWLDTSRHVELQIIGDTHGNLVHCFERECSIQRRHQKIIEEAPAPGIDEATRQRMGGLCVAACQRIGYRGAGTFEFLYEDGEFYFIEMNTRIQVEHPVTEMVTGIDLVKQQLRVAAGEELTIKQEDVTLTGHAIECRINAEDAYTFRPSPGQITVYHPAGGPGVRIDSHIYGGYVVPPYYDSLIGKLICHGETRDAAIARSENALTELVIEGIDTNIPLHIDLVSDAAFRAGGTDIHYLERRLGLI